MKLIVEEVTEKTARFICQDLLTSLSRTQEPYPLNQTVTPGVTITREAGYNKPITIAYLPTFTYIIHLSKQGISKWASKLYCDKQGIEPKLIPHAGGLYKRWPGGYKEKIR